MKFFKTALLLMTILSSSLFAKEFTVNLKGNEQLENFSVKIDLKVDQEGKVEPFQKFHFISLKNMYTFKLLTAPGLRGTMVNEREIIVLYKTSLKTSGLYINNLYKVGVGRLYYDEDTLNITFDNDYYQNIYSFLNYHNIKKELVSDLDNIYGSWQEI